MMSMKAAALWHHAWIIAERQVYIFNYASYRSQRLASFQSPRVTPHDAAEPLDHWIPAVRTKYSDEMDGPALAGEMQRGASPRS